MNEELDSYRAINANKLTASEARRARIVIWIMGTACAVAFAMVLATSAYAHEAKAGWEYEYSCCSSRDCREVTTAAVKEDEKGFTITATGEIIPYGDTRIKRSKDEFFHWCSVAGLADSRSICLYVPDRGY